MTLILSEAKICWLSELIDMCDEASAIIIGSNSTNWIDSMPAICESLKASSPSPPPKIKHFLGTLPERLIEANPAAYVRDVLGRRSAGLAPFDPRALAEYVRCMELSGTAHGICEDYRASAYLDLVHDQLDLDEKNFVQQPLMLLWGEQGVVHECFEPLKEWSKLATNVQGQAMPCGHYIPEEAPELLLKQLQLFLEAS